MLQVRLLFSHSIVTIICICWVGHCLLLFECRSFDILCLYALYIYEIHFISRILNYLTFVIYMFGQSGLCPEALMDKSRHPQGTTNINKTRQLHMVDPSYLTTETWNAFKTSKPPHAPMTQISQYHVPHWVGSPDPWSPDSTVSSSISP